MKFDFIVGLVTVSVIIFGMQTHVFASNDGLITIEGQFNIGEKMFADRSFSYEYYLFVDNGTNNQIPYFLEFENPPESLFDLSGNQVKVTGYEDSQLAKQSNKFLSDSKIINVESISLSNIQKASQIGKERAVPSTLKTVTILARYNGDSTEPHTKSYFQGRFLTASDSLNAYWQDTSYGAISMSAGTTDGTGVVDWQTLPNTKAGYGAGSGSSESTRRGHAIDLADPFVDFNGDDNIIQNISSEPQIGGPGDNGDDVDQVIIIYNDEFADGNYAFAFLDPVTISTDEGNLRVYLVHSPDTGNDFPVGINFENGVGVIAHEMGHNFEWEHTPPVGYDTYADEWSLMSGGGADGPPGTIAFNRDEAGWIPSEDKKTVEIGQQASFTLDILSDTSPTSNFLMGIVPFGASGNYYTIEARKDSTFDQTPLNQMGLLIYKFKPSGHPEDPLAAVVSIVEADSTAIGDLDNADLDKGKTFTDATNDISISYLDDSATTITVSVSNNFVGNSAPSATSQSVTAKEDTPKNITLKGIDANDDDLTFSIVTDPSAGTLSGLNSQTGVVTYTPDTDYSGTDSFTFKVNDGLVDSDPSTVSLTITAVNDVPTANAQSATTNEDTAVVITLTGSDPEGSSLKFSTAKKPAHGKLSGLDSNTGSVTYTPTADYNGNDSFTFKVKDEKLSSLAATVSLTVNPVDEPSGEFTISVNGTASDKDLQLLLSGDYECITSKDPRMNVANLTGTVTAEDGVFDLANIKVTVGKSKAQSIKVSSKVNDSKSGSLSTSLSLAKAIDCDTPLNVAALKGKNTMSSTINSTKYSVTKNTVAGQLKFDTATNSLQKVSGNFTVSQNGTALLSKVNHDVDLRITGNYNYSQAEGFVGSSLNGTLTIDTTQYNIEITKFTPSSDLKSITYSAKLTETTGTVTGKLVFENEVDFQTAQNQEALDNGKNTLKAKVQSSSYDTKKTSTGRIGLDLIT